jgi:prephenate dehydratase
VTTLSVPGAVTAWDGRGGFENDDYPDLAIFFRPCQPVHRRVLTRRAQAYDESAVIPRSYEEETMSVRKVDYFAMHVRNRAGEAACLLKELSKQGVNLLGFTGFPDGRRSQVDFIPANTARFLKAAKSIGLRTGKKKTGFLVRGKDRAGALGNVMDRLARAKINVTAVDGVSAGNGNFGAILWVKRQDVGRAARTLRAH